MTPIAQKMPRAWLGYAEGFGAHKVARICMDCADRAEAEAIALDRGEAMTHGFCEACGNAKLAEILSEETTTAKGPQTATT